MDFKGEEVIRLENSIKGAAPQVLCAALVLLGDDVPLAKSSILTAAARIIAESDDPDRVANNFAIIVKEHRKQIESRNQSDSPL